MSERDMSAEKRAHMIVLKDRAAAEVSGVSDVLSFDEEHAVLVTDCGELTLEGEALHVSTLDTAKGVVAVSGNINGFFYKGNGGGKRSLRERLFG